MLFEIVIGAVLAAISVWVIARTHLGKEHAFWRQGLLIAAIVYVVFSLTSQRWDYLPLEIIGVLLYGVFAWLSKKHALYWLAIGWALHIVWDVYFHLGPETAFVPTWYPGVCIGFDIVIGGYILSLYRKQTA